jgi:hypothetical protein
MHKATFGSAAEAWNAAKAAWNDLGAFPPVPNSDGTPQGAIERCKLYMPGLRNRSALLGEWGRYLLAFSPTMCSTWSINPRCTDPVCGIEEITSFLRMLQPNVYATNKMLDAAGWVAIEYRFACPGAAIPSNPFGSVRCLPNQDFEDDGSARAEAVLAIQRVGINNPTRALGYLSDCIDKEDNNFTMSCAVQAIGKLISWDVPTEVRNRAVASVGFVATHSTWDAVRSTAVAIYGRISKYLGTPETLETCMVPIPAVLPTSASIVKLKKTINVLAARYGINALLVSSTIDKSLVDTTFLLANQLAYLPKPSTTVTQYVKCPTLTSVEMLSPQLAVAFAQHAAQIPNYTTTWFKPVAIGTAIIVCGVVGYFVARKR